MHTEVLSSFSDPERRGAALAERCSIEYLLVELLQACVVCYPKKALGAGLSRTSYFRHQQQCVWKANLLLELSIKHSLSAKLVIMKKAPKVFICSPRPPFFFNYYKASFKFCRRWKCALLRLSMLKDLQSTWGALLLANSVKGGLN